MAINFPNSPVIGDLYTFASTTWQWSGEYWGVWTGTTAVITDYLPLSGGTVTGDVLFQSGVTATTITGNTIYGDGSNLTNVDNLYNIDGTLQSNRTVSTTSGYTLTINPQTTFSPSITSVTVTTATTIGTIFNPSLTASISGNTLIGLDISPTYTNSPHSNVTNIDLRTRNAGVVIGSSYGYGFLYGNSNDGIVEISDEGSFITRMTFRPSGNSGGYNGNWWSRIEQNGNNFRVYSGNYPTGQLSGQWLVGGPVDNSTTFGALFNNNGNIIVGSTTDSGVKLDSYGVTRIQNNFGVGTFSTPSQPILTDSTTGGAITGETTGTTYTYRIVGVDNLGYTTPAGTISSVSLSGLTNSVSLTWTAIAGISSYRVYRSNPWNSTNRFYNTSTNSFTDTGSSAACDGSGCNPPTQNRTLKTNISSSGNLFVNSNGTFTGNVLIGGVSSGFEINTTSSTVPIANVGIYRKPGNGNSTYFIEDEQGGAKDKWTFVRRGGYGLVRDYYQGNSSIVNINLGWTNPNTNGWDANTLLIDPVINKTNAFSTTIRGIYYNPILSGMTGVTHIAYQNTTGDNILNSLSGNTLIGTTVDSGHKLSISATTNPIRIQGLQISSGDTRILTSDSNGVIGYRNLSSALAYSTTGITVSSQTLTTSFNYYGVNYNGDVDLTLPNPSGYDGYNFTIKDEGGYAATHRIRLIPSSGLIDGNNYVDINLRYVALHLMARDNNWWII